MALDLQFIYIYTYYESFDKIRYFNKRTGGNTMKDLPSKRLIMLLTILSVMVIA